MSCHFFNILRLMITFWEGISDDASSTYCQRLHVNANAI